MTEQSDAQFLADKLDCDVWHDAAAELRRLDALNAELVEAVEAALSDDQPYIEKCRAALAKARGGA